MTSNIKLTILSLEEPSWMIFSIGDFYKCILTFSSVDFFFLILGGYFFMFPFADFILTNCMLF